jgi:hypothetical protein
MSGKRVSVAAAVAGLLAIGGVSAGTAAAANAAAAPASSGPQWRIVKALNGETAGLFTDVVATGKSTGWAFQEPGVGGPDVAWELVSGVWTKEPFPANPNDFVGGAAATSPSDVWAVASTFGAGSRVLHFNGHKWSVARVFKQNIGSLSARSATDVFAFGSDAVLHFDGHAWSPVATPVDGGSVLSDRDIWGFSGTNIEHWTGHKWAVTSVKKLLPPVDPHGLNDPMVADILALSDTNVYATGSGNAQDAGGPIVLLHYDGHTWRQVANAGFGGGGGLSLDGRGGLWITFPGESGAPSHMLHYANGKLTKITLPRFSAVASISRVPGTTRQLAAGFAASKSGGLPPTGAVILQYS